MLALTKHTTASNGLCSSWCIQAHKVSPVARGVLRNNGWIVIVVMEIRRRDTGLAVIYNTIFPPPSGLWIFLWFQSVTVFYTYSCLVFPEHVQGKLVRRFWPGTLGDTVFWYATWATQVYILHFYCVIAIEDMNAVHAFFGDLFLLYVKVIHLFGSFLAVSYTRYLPCLFRTMNMTFVCFCATPICVLRCYLPGSFVH